MGLDLNLHILRDACEVRGGHTSFPQSVLGLDRQYSIFAKLTEIDGYPEPVVQVRDLPKGMMIFRYEDEGLQTTRTSPYGDDLVFCYAEDLKGLELPESATPMNKAAFEFVCALPDDTPIVIEWR